MSSEKKSRAAMMPLLDMDKKIYLHSVKGPVSSIADFVKRFGQLLTDYEQCLLNQHQELFGTLCENLPFDAALTIDSGNNNAMVARSIGSRSALLESHNLYFKGCRKLDDESLWFPSVSVDILTGQFHEQSIPFGVLSAENVMREILGFVLLHHYGWPKAREPIAVIEYANTQPASFALVFSTNNQYVRTEQLLQATTASCESPNLVERTITIESIMASALANRMFDLSIEQPSLNIAGADITQYLQQKAQLLAATHAKGVFRGFLNANAGNDMYRQQSDTVALVDFDTLEYLNLFSISESQRVQVLGCGFIEAAKSLLPALSFFWCQSTADFDCVIDEQASANEFINLYANALASEVLYLGWEINVVEQARRRAFKHPLFRSCIADNFIHNTGLVNGYAPNQSLYRKQY